MSDSRKPEQFSLRFRQIIIDGKQKRQKIICCFIVLFSDLPPHIGPHDNLCRVLH